MTAHSLTHEYRHTKRQSPTDGQPPVVSRRRCLGAFGVATSISMAGCLGVFNDEDLGESVAGGQVIGNVETFDFEAYAGTEIIIEINILDERANDGEITLTDPEGAIAEQQEILLTESTRISHLAEHDGIYSLEVVPANARLSVSVFVVDADE